MNARAIAWIEIAAMIATVPRPATGAPERVSAPGRYAGYSPVLFDGYQRSSEYVRVRDGTRIAIDIFRPTRNGRVVGKRLPVIWMNTPYGRRVDNEGDETAKYYPGAALALVKYGYVVAVADMRGNYASFGKALHSNRTEWAPWAYWDAYDVTEWLAGQPWSDSKIGMWGCSATGHSQWQAAATHPPHLKAIYPMSAPSEYYDWNGVSATTPSTPAPYPGPVPRQDAGAAAVDGDAGNTLLQQAKEEHRYNLDYGFVPYRDSVSPEVTTRAAIPNFRPWLEANTFTHFGDLNKGGIPAYETANFGEDERVKVGVFVKLRNLHLPVKLVFAPGNHCNWSSEYRTNALNSFNAPAEELRWFDYWLKGVRNGILDEPPIYYFTYNARKGQEWHFAWQWPLPNERGVNYYLAPGKSGDPHHAGLSLMPPSGRGGADRYTVDYEVTPANRNETGMTFTSEAMSSDTVMTGHPVVHLWVTSTATDGDVFAALADVAPDGKVTMLPGTDDGQIRISMRRLGTAPYDNLGLPYHRAFAADREPLALGQPAALVFDLAPISWVFRPGHRFRLVVTGSAVDHHGAPPATPVLHPAPVLSFLRDARHASYVTMPALAPLQVPAAIARRGRMIEATISFPRSLDTHYLDDLEPASMTLNGRAAASIRHAGHRLIVTFSGPVAKTSVINGAFGGRYNYGDLMRFVAGPRRHRQGKA